ncbi:MAG: TetR/AcrR family transcriptional regulator [Actinomycetota bacterium]|nr:TetR/AcrR family transcriptional regulator [Actinomycetota bacterium]
MGPAVKQAAAAEALDDRLVTVALELLRSQPADRLSLRQVAQRLGVSHQAPYVNFGDKRTFLAAVAGTGLRQAAQQATAVLADSGGNPLRRLHALVEAYADFIRDYPHVHDLAYGPLVAKADHPGLEAAASAYWDLLHHTVSACQPADTAEAEVLRRCAAAWGTVYGIARLATLRQIPASVPGELRDLLREAVDTLYEGWQVERPLRPQAG